ncbi:BOI-related E3 ubiquitin-protein ligase 1-like [Sesamum indicum]|uniref:BOI-related E3 ubiquitin-protein ligase 1-like n=1 Tax=Sesamum indicum TaxID=4182 RepID=A0A8M8UZ23_SESIN|nr:BOI-related E3 ubiquitin-protein ligase 1-like [Sesamum indicum]
MFANNGGAPTFVGAVPKDSRKRKMKEVEAETIEHTPAAAASNQINLFNLHGPHFASLNGRHSQVQQILNNAAPFKPFSFTSLLTAADEDDLDSLSMEIKNQTEQVDQILLFHNENLRQSLAGVLGKHRRTLHRVAEEKAAKKLKAKELELHGKLSENAELERMVEHYKGEAERLLIRVRCLERTTMSLQAGLQEANAARRYAETEQEDAESSYEDPDRVGPVRLDCKACERPRVVWGRPRHICVCTRCDSVTKVCPVCCSLKTTSVEVCLPLD